MVAKIATGEIEDVLDESRPYGMSTRGRGRPSKALASKGGRKPTTKKS